MGDIIENMDLPLVNPNEDLETISNNYLRPLFAVDFFEMRPEQHRDKGIDFIVELKKHNKYTNFRFLIQLKATDSVNYNKDGSFSLSIATSNIQYLLNGGIPAFYILFIKNSGKFYYENLNEFLSRISTGDSDWQKQNSHTLRFSKDLTAEALREIYQKTLQHGLFKRAIDEKLVYKTASFDSGDKIVIDSNLNVTDDTEIRKIIENAGFDLINEGNWKDIISLHKRASGNVATTAKYNLILGIVYYYTSNFIDALSHFKKATLAKNELSAPLQNHLRYFDTSVKFYMGIINEKEYSSIIDELDKDDDIGFFIRTEKVKNKYYEGVKTMRKEAYSEFEEEINQIINNLAANENTKLLARCELMYNEGMKNNMDFIHGIAQLHGLEEVIGPNMDLRIESAQAFITTNSNWYESCIQLLNDAFNQKYYFTYHIACLYNIKVQYNFIVHAGSFKIMKEIPGYPVQQLPDNSLRVRSWIVELDKIALYFQQMGHMQNVCVAMSTKYELLHYLKEYDGANDILQQLDKIIVDNDLRDQKHALDLILKDGTTHQRFETFFKDAYSAIELAKQEMAEMNANMKRMDKEDAAKQRKSGVAYGAIHLFPLGYFRFPVNDIATVFDILNIRDNPVKTQFASVFAAKAIPIANVYYNPITEEGLVDGHLGDKGLESWKNMYRVRKTFFENKYYFFEIRIPR